MRLDRRAGEPRLGPAVGGALAGLPIVLGPGFFFLMREAEAGFVAQAATALLGDVKPALSATRIIKAPARDVLRAIGDYLWLEIDKAIKAKAKRAAKGK